MRFLLPTVNARKPYSGRCSTLNPAGEAPRPLAAAAGGGGKLPFSNSKNSAALSAFEALYFGPWACTQPLTLYVGPGYMTNINETIAVQPPGNMDLLQSILWIQDMPMKLTLL